MTELDHGVETTRGTFVVSHEGTSEDKWQYAVKKKQNYLISNLIRQVCLGEGNSGSQTWQTMCHHCYFTM